MRKYRTKLSIMGVPGTGKSNKLRTGGSVPDSGIYQVTHAEHHLPKEVTLIRNQWFPRCSKCAGPVYFELVRSAPHIGVTQGGFNVMLYELPEVPEKEESGHDIVNVAAKLLRQSVEFGGRNGRSQFACQEGSADGRAASRVWRSASQPANNRSSGAVRTPGK